MGDSEEGIPSATVFDYISREFEPINTELLDMDIRIDKQSIFFSKIKRQEIAFLSPDTEILTHIQQSLGKYFNISMPKKGEELHNLLTEKKVSVVFIDLHLPKESIQKLFNTVRSYASRRKTSIILLATKVNRADLIRYKSLGTDHIIVSPFTAAKFYDKVYAAMSIDRKN
jgi:DNA-binding response OmpR family regulator